MNHHLEDRIEKINTPAFKSAGERRIADFLDTNSIKYQYEPGLLVYPVGEKPRIWYPDYRLPEFETYIEYYGLPNKSNYHRGIKIKESVYSKMGLDVIPVYPWMFEGHWQGYINRELEKITKRRYKALQSKPYWKNSGSFRSNRYPTLKTGYRKSNRHY